MDSKSYRLREFIRPDDGRSLVVDASAGLSLGALPGLEQFQEAVKPILPLVDGIVASPGQARRLARRTRSEAALLLRADWTNALRGPGFVLPPEITSHVNLLDPSDALDLGASALVLYFLLGHEEHIEAGCLQKTVQLALQGSRVGLPLVLTCSLLGRGWCCAAKLSRWACPMPWRVGRTAWSSPGQGVTHSR
jgi:DhnA family fructose-bisphosphate aldolase class Ia